MESRQHKLDRLKRRDKWLRARQAEGRYQVKLSQLAKQIKSIIDGFAPDGTLAGIAPLVNALTKYAEVIEPWAQAIASFMLADVNNRNLVAWKQHSDELGRSLRADIHHAPMGGVYRDILRENVKLIKSLPQKAAIEVHQKVQEGMLKSTRSTEIAKEILKTSSVPAWRAKLIARTEVSRASVVLTQARAMAIGSQGYIWRTVGDGDVRPTHKEQDGKYILWSTPPKTDKSLAPYHAGCGPNCRCWPEPMFPEY